MSKRTQSPKSKDNSISKSNQDSQTDKVLLGGTAKYGGSVFSSSADSENGDSNSDAEKPDNNQIHDMGSVTSVDGKHPIYCLTIIGQIEGHYTLPSQNKTTKYEHVIPQLVAVEQSPEINGLLIILNTVGGDVEAGLAIAELISGMKKPTVSLVLGGGHSIGVPLACSATRSFIVPSATMTIHPVRMNGMVLGVPQTMSYFERIQDRIMHFVEMNSGMKPTRFKELMMNNEELVMDVGSMLDGQVAVEEGLIDNLGGLSDAVECLYDLIEAEEARKSEPKKKVGRPKKAGPQKTKKK